MLDLARHLKALYQDIRAACYYFWNQPHSVMSSARKHRQYPLAAWHLLRPQLSIDLWWRVSPEMKAKIYRKEKQTDFSAPLSILTISISLALSPDCGRSARPAGQAWKLRHHKTTICGARVQMFPFPGPEKYKRHHVTVFYLLYADTVPLTKGYTVKVGFVYQSLQIKLYSLNVSA